MKKIAITGPESTGKSFLASELAKLFNTVYVPEKARSYIDQLGRPYNLEDLLFIARKQIEEEEKLISIAREFLFCDTELIVLKIWSLHKYKSCHEWILDRINKNKYDLFLLCDIDMPWEYDPQREHPELREYFLEWYKRELKNYGFPYKLIKGTGHVRTENAVKTIQNFFNE